MSDADCASGPRSEVPDARPVPPAWSGVWPSAGDTSNEWRRIRRVFMFTDIVGSTSLAEAMGDVAWNHLLRWHDETLRSLIGRYGGEEVNRLGDGFFVAFDDATAAVACAVAIQRGLARHRREHGFSPPVRIGIHEAEATVVDGDYRGKGVHEAARITDAATGDEIVASEHVAVQLPPEGQRDRRSLVLKGLSRRVEVVTIEWRSPSRDR